MKDVKLLDCTLRDGGYYTNWNFDVPVVAAYLDTMDAAKVDRIEIGFRGGDGTGRFANISDPEIEKLTKDNSCEIGVMVNIKDVKAYGPDPDRFVEDHFSPASRAPISFVRIAAHMTEVQDFSPLYQALSLLGYHVMLNVMQCDDLGADAGQAIAKQVQEIGYVDTLYFADSLGCMSPEDVGELIRSARKSWLGDIGFHAHDNLQDAVWNCRSAIDASADCVDGTVCGMGRGAGNASTLALAMRLGKKPEPLRRLSLQHFNQLQKTYGWGYNEFYCMAAEYKVHPTYVQAMLLLGCKAKIIASVIDELHGEGRHFSQSKLDLLVKKARL